MRGSDHFVEQCVQRQQDRAEVEAPLPGSDPEQKPNS